MPEPRTWYRDPNHEEFFIPLPDKQHELRLRVRLSKRKIRNSNRKQLVEFFIGLEIYTHEDWKTIIAYCNRHEKVVKFHIHNKKRLKTVWGSNYKIPMRIANKRVPASQFRWSKKNLIHYFNYYAKQYIKRVER